MSECDLCEIVAGRSPVSPTFRPGPVPRDQIPGEEELHRFSTRIFKIGINPVVDVPEEVSEALDARGPFAVAGLLNEVPIRATLVPAGAARHRLFINTAMRDAAGVGAGDTVTLALARDPHPRPIEMPTDLRTALEEREGALALFQSRTPAWRREVVAWLEDAKRPPTRRKRVRRIVADLLDTGED